MSIQKLDCVFGDLAIVTSAHLPQNIGQIVEVISVQTGKPFGLSGEGHIWQVRAISGRATLRYRFKSGQLMRRVCGPVPDHRLRPVSRLPESDIAAMGFDRSESLSSDSS